MNILNDKFIAIFILCMILGTIAQAQLDEARLDSVLYISQLTYDYKKGDKSLKIEKESFLDTNQIMYKQERTNYVYVDAKRVKSMHYAYTYDPKTRRGEYYTERFPVPNRKKSKYSKRVSKFKSFDHKSKYEWIKHYNSKDEIQQDARFEYDSHGERTYNYQKNYAYNPPTVHIDEMERNDRGELLKWVSYDEQEGKKEQVRDFNWEYQDTLLVRSSGYVFNNWNETEHQYKKGVLKKSTQNIGYRQDKGKVIIDHKISTKYKNGLPFKKMEHRLGKKESTTSYTYAPNYIEEKVVTKTETKVIEEKKLMQNGLLVEKTDLLDGKPTLSEKNTYSSGGRLQKHVEIEYRKNGDEWKTVFEFNKRNNLTRKTFLINEKLRQEDLYTYKYREVTE